MPGKWTKAQRRKFEATMKRNRLAKAYGAGPQRLLPETAVLNESNGETVHPVDHKGQTPGLPVVRPLEAAFHAIQHLQLSELTRLRATPELVAEARTIAKGLLDITGDCSP